MRKFGSRLFLAIVWLGVGKGSFVWFIDQIEQLMDLMDDATCAEDDMETIIAWWIHSALKEAGSHMARSLKRDH